MTKKVLILFIFGNLLLSGQKQLTVNQIWNDDFSPNRMESLKSMKNGNKYSIIEIDLKNRESKIISKDYDSFENQEIVLDSKNELLVPFFTSYKFSKDEQKILISTKEDKIYRRSTRSIYWVYDRTDKSIKMIFNKKIQEPSLSLIHI